jgi:hypothetical protein
MYASDSSDDSSEANGAKTGKLAYPEDLPELGGEAYVPDANANSNIGGFNAGAFGSSGEGSGENPIIILSTKYVPTVETRMEFKFWDSIFCKATFSINQ